MIRRIAAILLAPIDIPGGASDGAPREPRSTDAAQTLEDRSSMLAALVNATTGAVYLKDVQGRYLLFNPAAEAITGKSAAEVVGKEDTAVFAPAEAAVLPGPDPLIGSFLLDNSDHASADRALRESEERFRTLIESANDAIFIWDMDLRCLEANRAACDRLGYTRAELLTMTTAQISAPEQGDVAAARAEVIARQGSAFVETVHMARDGTRIPVEVSTTVTSLGGRPVFLSIARDITARKAAEAEAAVANERVRQFFNAGIIGTLVARPDGTIIEANDYFLAMIGRTREEFERGEIDWRSITPPEQQRVTDRAIAGMQQLGRGGSYEKEYLRPDGTRVQALVVAGAMPGTTDQGAAFVLDISDRKRSEARFVEQTALLQSVIDSSEAAVFAVDREYRYTAFNGQHAEVMRALYGAEIELGRSLLDYQRPAGDDVGAKRNLDRALAGERFIDEGFSGEEGRTRAYFEVIHAPVRDPEGQVVGISVFARDITERKRADQAVRELAQLVDLANDAIIVRTSDSRVRFWSRGAAALYGWTAAEADGRVTHDLLQTVFPVSVESTDDDLESSGRWQGELLHTTRDGGRVVVDSRQSMERGSAGVVTAIIEINRDVTERRRAEAEVRAASDRLRRFVDSAVFGFTVTRADGTVVEANDYYLDVVGYSREELERGEIDWRTLTPPEWLPVDERGIAEVLERGVCAPYEKEYQRRDGSRVSVLLAYAALPDSQDLAVFVLDISERKRAEDELEQALEEIQALNAGLEARVVRRTIALEAANRELEAFSYSVSHDLRAPLRSIAAFSQILLNEYAAPIDPEGLRMLGVVIRNVQAMGRLIDDLLAFSKVSRSELDHRPVDMGRLALSVADEIRAAEPDREIAFDIGPLAAAPGDAALLRQVWVNLLGNAVKFSGPTAHATVEVRSERVDGECCYTVRDNGVGFDPAYLDKLFLPFSRLHPTAEFEGTGIGLAIVARIVARHDGRVWADGTPGGGATFGFALPTGTEAA